MSGIVYFLICLVIWLLPASLADALAYDRAAITAGEWWRLWGGHFVEQGFYPLLTDAGMVAILAHAIEIHYGRLRTALLLFSSPLLISLPLWLALPSVTTFAGATAVVSMLWALGCCMVMDRVPRSQTLFWIALLMFAGLFAKIAAAGAAAQPDTLTVAWQANLAGALLGIAAFLPDRWRRQSLVPEQETA